MAPYIKRDLYSEVTSHILAELEGGAAPWVKPWSATPGQNVPQNAVTNRAYSGCNVILLWLARGQGLAHAALRHVQASARGWRQCAQGRTRDQGLLRQAAAGDGGRRRRRAERLVPMMREYTVFNVAQCEGLPASIMDGKPARVRNPDTRDALADEFLTPRRADDFAQPAFDLFFLADLSDLARLEHFFHCLVDDFHSELARSGAGFGPDVHPLHWPVGEELFDMAADRGEVALYFHSLISAKQDLIARMTC
jgi:antirestriction protein ArdC